MCKGISSGITRMSVKEKLSSICMRLKRKPQSVLGICCSVVVLVVTAVVFPAAQVNAQKFKDTFMERCLAYPEQPKTCERVWTIFEQAYVGKDDSDVSSKSYSELFDKMPFTHPCDKTIFWSGTRDISQDLVHRFTKNSDYFITLEDTLLGHLLNGLTWCGKKNSKETFTKCDDKNPKAVVSFWEMASMKLAQYACEVATVMLDGKKPQPFYDKSAFGKAEVPNLQPGRVKQLTIVLITESNRNQCNNESVKNLENTVKSKGISSDCKEVTISHIEECIKGKKYKSCW